MISILPAILDKTVHDFIKHINQLKNSLAFKEGWVHIDFTDNKFVQNETISVDIVAQTKTNLYKEAHLMVVHPLQWIEPLQKAGFKRVIFHYESKDNVLECVNKIKELGMEAGVALKIETPVNVLEPYNDKISLVLIMSVVPGFQGQPFLPESLDKIRELKSKNWPLKIAVDGAIKDVNAKQLVEAGVDQLTIGSYLLNGNIDDNLERLWVELSK